MRYVVQPGDTLSRIAQVHLGNASRWPEIMKWNNLTKTVLFPGQELFLQTTEPAKSTLADKVVEYARKFVGVREVRQNRQWTAHTEELLAIMTAVGWNPGDAYCMAFCAGIWRKVFDDAKIPMQFRRCLSWLTPGVQDSWNRIPVEQRAASPAKGAIFFLAVPGTRKGHAGLIVSSKGSLVTTIEGNTSSRDSVEQQRQGDYILSKLRVMHKSVGKFRLLGYLHLPEVN